ncbi:MAG TPA: ROK family protein [Candidatus Limnocylindrales bacterium]
MTRQPIGQRSETVRRANLSSIVLELHLRGAASRSELVARTGLTRSAIRELTGELIEAGLAREERGPSLGSPGRPSPIVLPEAYGLVVLGLELSVDSLAAALVGFGGRVLARARVNRPRGSLSVEASVDELVRLAGPMLAMVTDSSRLAGVGLAVVGSVRREDGFVASAPNLGWRDVPLGTLVAAALDVEAAITVANDADLGALAERRRGAARGIDDLVFISGEVGVGGGVIAGGRPMTGVAGYAGEIGHVAVNPAGATCRCGSVGCWETEIGEPALLKRAGLPADGGRDGVDRLLASAGTGQPQALAALDATGAWLGTGLAGLVNIFDPRVIVLGGLFSRIHPFVAPTVAARLERHALAASRALVRVVPAELGPDAVLLGAAEAAFDAFLADPAARLQPRAAGAAGARSTTLPGESPAPARPRAGAVRGLRRGGTMRRDIPAARSAPRDSAGVAHHARGEGGSD